MLFVVLTTGMAKALSFQVTIAELTSVLLLATAASNLLLGFYIKIECRIKRRIQLIASLLVLGSALTAVVTVYFPRYTLSNLTLNEITQLLLAIGVGLYFVINFQSLNPCKSVVHTGVGREAGTVKWFNVTKGFGFISRDSGDDVFVHYRAIRGEGHRALREGQRVDFAVIENDKGLQAEDVMQQSGNH